MSLAPEFQIGAVELFERDVVYRMPFRFGAATLHGCPQAFARVTIRDKDGREATGSGAELLAPKWFDKNPALSNEANFEQLRRAIAIARDNYRSQRRASAFGHFARNHQTQLDAGARHGLDSLVAGFGPALLDRAVLDALCRLQGLDVFTLARRNLIGLRVGPLTPDLRGFDLDAFLAGLTPLRRVAARHTVGLIDPLTGQGTLRDGLPETLEQVIRAYGHRWFKLKIGGDVQADVARLCAIARVLDAEAGDYAVTLDGNEQYQDAGAVAELWRAVTTAPDLRRLARAIRFIEQPLDRARTLETDISALDLPVPFIIDESDHGLDVYPRARALGYQGVSSKSCKGLYKSMLNAARTAMWNAEAGGARYLMSGEDLSTQAGLGVQQDLALVALLGIDHVERNGHHYVDGFQGASAAEAGAFLAAHPDLYRPAAEGARLRIEHGKIRLASLAVPGYATALAPDWSTMREMATPA